jgi:inorganic phosphate transporter, PiT family
MLVIIIITALVFDFLNGRSDAANSIATVVSTRVLSPRQAIAWAAFFNFVAAFGFGVHVANTIGKGVIDTSIVDQTLIMAALLAAITWTNCCIQWGIPISVSHALIGGLCGAAIAKAGVKALVMSGLLKIAAFIVITPCIGFVLSFIIAVITFRIARKSAPGKVDRWFRRLQIASAAAYSLGHGANDAQKTMGIIALALFSAGKLTVFHVPIWVILSCHAAIALGTLAGGWKVIKTMGHKITKLRPVDGFCSETAGAISIIGASLAGIPVSTTHTISGAIMGVGATRRLSAVKWGVARRIVIAWVVTIPICSLISFLLFTVYRIIWGQ